MSTKSFLEACGATGPLLLSIEGPGGTGAEPVAFELPCLLVGRNPDAHLDFPHPDVSERHVYLQMVAGRLRYLDLGSRRGTFLGGQSLPTGWLSRRQAIRVGPYRIRLLGGDAEPDPGLEPTPPADAAWSRWSLDLAHRGTRPERRPVLAALTLLGTAPDCGVRLLDPTVANYHCSLLATPAGCWVVDLLGPSGVRLNGAPARLAQVHDGDELRLGHSLVRLRAEPRRVRSATGAEAVSGLPAPAILAEALAAPLAQIKDQVIEQMRQTGRELFEAIFPALHGEQLELLRTELDQFRRLTHELETLRGALVERLEELDRPQRSPFLAPASPPPPRLGLATTAPRRLPAPAGLDEPSSLPILPPAPIEPNPGDRNGHGDPDPDAASPRPDADVYAWLSARISTIQTEQQSRWAKIRNLIPGPLLDRTTA